MSIINWNIINGYGKCGLGYITLNKRTLTEKIVCFSDNQIKSSNNKYNNITYELSLMIGCIIA